MTVVHRGRAFGAKGVALLELLVATAIVLLLAGSLLMIAVPSHGGFRAQPEAIDVQQRLRIAADAIRRDVESAGSGPVNPLFGVPLGAVVPAVLPWRIGLRRADPPGTYRDDLITLISAAPASAAAPITTDFQGSSGGVVVNVASGCPVAHPSCGLEAGASVLLVDPGGQWDLYGVASAVAATVNLQARGVSSGRRYAAGSRLIPIDIATYYWRAATGPDGPQLARYDGSQSDLPQVDHLAALSFEYFGDPQPPRPRAPPEQAMTYGPRPPFLGEDDERDSWGAGENCVVAVDDGRQVPRLAVLSVSTSLQPLDRGAFSDGPWCPDAAAANRFDADLLRIRKVRITLRVEAWADSLRGADRRFFLRPGVSPGGASLVPDQQVTFEVVPRTLGGGR